MKRLTLTLIAVTTLPALAKDIKLKDCPEAVQETIEKKLKGGEIDDLEIKTNNGNTRYVVEIEGPGDREVKYKIKPSGTISLVNKVIKFSDCPSKVKKAVKADIKSGWKIDDDARLKKNSSGNKYKVEVDRDNQKDLIYKVLPNGKIVDIKKD